MNNIAKYAIAIAATAIVAIVGTLAYVSMLQPSPQHPISQNLTIASTSNTSQVLIQSQILKKFNSTDDLQKFLIDSQAQTSSRYSGSGLEEKLGLAQSHGMQAAPVPSTTPSNSLTPQGAQSPSGNLATTGVPYSTTNVQVAGIDEPDFLKNDNKYAYILSQDKITIVDAYPGQTAKIISKVGLDLKGQSLENMFLNKDRLVVFYNDNTQSYAIPQYDYLPNPVYTPVTHAVIIDVSDKSNPKILKNYEITGYYTGARMIGDYVYLISNSYVDYIHPLPPILRESSGLVMKPDVYYFGNPESNYNFNTITSFNIFSDEVNSKTFLLGDTGTLYVSNDAIYIAYQKYYPYYYDQSYSQDRFFKAILPLLPDDLQSQINSVWTSTLDPSQKWAQISDLMQNTYNKMSETDKNALFDKISKAITEYDINVQQDYRKTVIQKFAINNGTVTFAANGTVSGYLLNQYSMDEFGNRLRVATTSEYYTSNGATTTNNVFVLDGSLNVVGSLEKVAPQESIYAARFMGDRLYLVTYQRIDPFFVIDLTTDTPKVLGALKIPGYSSYLHPYDETHIIGIGKETEQNQYGGTIPLGVKISLFDVSDVSAPVTVDNYTIGGPSSDSDVLNDPKALLFDKEKNILVIPVRQQNYYPIPMVAESQANGGSPGTVSSGNATAGPNVAVMPGRPIIMPPYFNGNNWSGFYVFGVDPTKGFTLKGIVTHYNGTQYQPYYYPQGSRSFYINDTLYTVTSDLMKMNDLNNINDTINEIKLSGTGQLVRYLNQ